MSLFGRGLANVQDHPLRRSRRRRKRSSVDELVNSVRARRRTTGRTADTVLRKQLPAHVVHSVRPATRWIGRQRWLSASDTRAGGLACRRPNPRAVVIRCGK